MSLTRLAALLAVPVLAACAAAPPTPTPRAETIVPRGTISFSGASTQTDGQFALYAMDANGANRRLLAQVNGDILGAKWSPDGRQIVASIEQDGATQVYVLGGDGKGQRLLSRQRSAVNPEWSPDGTRIAFAAGEPGRMDLYVVNTDGTGQRKLNRTSGTHVQPAWSPDGTSIVYSAAVSDSLEFSQTMQLWITDLSGSAQQLTRNAAADYQYPSWSHDGKKLAFAADPTGTHEIYAMDFATKDVRPLTSAGQPATQPRYSPDDKLIVYTTLTADGWRLHLMTADGQSQTPIDAKDVSEFLPDWKQ